MTHTIKDGWAHVNGGWKNGSGETYGMSLRCTWDLNVKAPEVTIEHYAGDGQIGFDLGTRERTVNLSNVYFDNSGDAAFCLEALHELNTGETTVIGYDLELQVHGDETMFPLINGTGTVMKVLATDIANKFEKVPFGDGQVYRIGKIKFEQSS